MNSDFNYNICDKQSLSSPLQQNKKLFSASAPVARPEEVDEFDERCCRCCCPNYSSATLGCQATRCCKGCVDNQCEKAIDPGSTNVSALNSPRQIPESPNKNLDSTNNNNNTKKSLRRRIIDELLTTEADYVELLQNLVHVSYFFC